MKEPTWHTVTIDDNIELSEDQIKKYSAIFKKIEKSGIKIVAKDEMKTEGTNKAKRKFTLEEWKNTWMSKLGESKTLFISATEKANFEEFREKVYEAVREIHITRFPYNKFLYPDYKDAVENE